MKIEALAALASRLEEVLSQAVQDGTAAIASCEKKIESLTVIETQAYGQEKNRK